MPEPVAKSNYHHGDLRRDLLDAANLIIKNDGIEGLSLRKLANQVGVSRTAPYHHFKNKNELLCAIAEQGFKRRIEAIEKFQSKMIASQNTLYQYMLEYVTFAQQNPELYELMFGRSIWKAQVATQELKDVAYPSFQHQIQITKQWQTIGILDPKTDPLRLSQVVWGSMHGIAKLLIDGIYTDKSQIGSICKCASEQFSSKLSSPKQ